MAQALFWSVLYLVVNHVHLMYRCSLTCDGGTNPHQTHCCLVAGGHLGDLHCPTSERLLQSAWILLTCSSLAGCPWVCCNRRCIRHSWTSQLTSHMVAPKCNSYVDVDSQSSQMFVYDLFNALVSYHIPLVSLRAGTGALTKLSMQKWGSWWGQWGLSLHPW